MDNQELLKRVRKEFGQDSMFILGDEKSLTGVKFRSSGSLMLDIALGGGLAEGRLCLLKGPEKAGKSSILYLAIAEAQQKEPNKKCGIIDLENAFSPDWAVKLGVDLDSLFIAQPDTSAEKVYDMVEFLVQTGEFSILGVDSVDGLVTQAELEEEDWTKESRVGGTSKLNSKGMRKIIYSGLLRRSGTTLIMVQQLRDAIGQFSAYGTPTTSTGGRGIRHASTQTLEVSIGDLFTKGSGSSKETLGQQIKVKVSKNKVGPPFRTAAIDVYYEHGVDRIMELVNVAKAINVLSGTSWLRVVNPLTGEVVNDAEGNELKFNGAAKVKEAIADNIENGDGSLYDTIYDLVQEVLHS